MEHGASLAKRNDAPHITGVLHRESIMRLLVQWVDMRGGYTSQVAWRTDVIDQDTGKKVGFVDAERSPASRHISLFGGKYEGRFSSSNSIAECDAFAKGVETVLNHMVAADEEQEDSEVAAA
jgi:hypothetical protein